MIIRITKQQNSNELQAITMTKTYAQLHLFTVFPPLSGHQLTEHSIIQREMTVLLEYFL